MNPFRPVDFLNTRVPRVHGIYVGLATFLRTAPKYGSHAAYAIAGDSLYGRSVPITTNIAQAGVMKTTSATRSPWSTSSTVA
jgi:hypothetical protein